MAAARRVRVAGFRRSAASVRYSATVAGSAGKPSSPCRSVNRVKSAQSAAYACLVRGARAASAYAVASATRLASAGETSGRVAGSL
jgi:hypothetical protein